MISAPNHPQPLSGNKFFFVLFAFLLIGFASCDAFRKAQTDDPVTKDEDELPEVQGDTVYNPETGKYEHTTSVTEELDTVRWKVTSRDEAPPITSEATVDIIENPADPTTTRPDDGKSKKLASYNVALLLPFLTDGSAEGTLINNYSLPALNFYGGVKMALDKLSSEGVRLNVTVHDTKGSEAETQNLMKTSALQSAHMIIGPIRKSNVKVAAQLSKSMAIPLISPLSPSSGVTSDNPYFVQVNPYLRTHCQAIINHARKRYSADKIVLVVRNKTAEISRLKYFQEANKDYEQSDFTKRLEEFIVTDESADFNKMDVAPYINEGDTTVFIVPSWSNESFIYSLLRKIQVARLKNEVIVYGMPQWIQYDRISYDYYEQLKVHVSSGIFIDSNSDEVINFKRNYFDRYGTPPSEEAYVGYDVMLFFGRMIAKHGTRFQDRLDVENADYMHTKFNFVREVPLSAILEEDYTKTNLIENKYVNILKFEDYYFQPAD